MAERITTSDAAKRIGLSRSRIMNMIRNGEVKAKKLGRDWTILDTHLARIQKRKRGTHLDDTTRAQREKTRIENLQSVAHKLESKSQDDDQERVGNTQNHKLVSHMNRSGDESGSRSIPDDLSDYYTDSE